MAFEDQLQPKPSPLRAILRVILWLLVIAVLIYLIFKFVVPKVKSLVSRKNEITASFQPVIPTPFVTSSPTPSPSPTAKPTVVAVATPKSNKPNNSGSEALPTTGPETPLLAVLGGMTSGAYGLYYLRIKQSHKKAARDISVITPVE